MRTRKYILLAALFAAATLSAQQVNTLYFLESAPMRHLINPAFQPVSRIYIGLSPLSYTAYNITNNVAFSDLIYKYEGKTITPLYPGQQSQFMNKVGKTFNTKLDVQADLLSIGARTKDGNGYVHVGLTERVNGLTAMSSDLVNLLSGGGSAEGQSYNLNASQFNISAYMEFMAGYSHRINDQWTVGAKLKFLYANAYFGLNFDDFTVSTTMQQLKAKISGNVMMAGGFIPEIQPGQSLGDIVSSVTNTLKKDYLALIKAGGYGGAMDLGATYKPIKQLQVSLAVTDLGFIHWIGPKGHVGGESSYSGTTMKFEDVKNLNGNQITDSIRGFFNNLYEQVVRTDGAMDKSYNTMLNCKLNVGVDANFWDNRVGVGVFSRTSFYSGRVYEEVTLGAALRPANWFNLALSYSFIDGNWNCMGLGLNLMPYDGLCLTLTTDYLPFTYTNTKELGFSKEEIPLPYKVKSLNFALGLNIVVGSNDSRNKKDEVLESLQESGNELQEKKDKKMTGKDSDGDGIPDRIDMDPHTPANVRVCLLGFPIDLDGDGIPDHLDKCNETPDAAYGMIDENGCPIDSDGDGVPDYLDECPDTPAESAGYVDEKGCSKDSDGDGVPDFKDHCPATPAEARGSVDNHGCPIDSDADGVADYKDECPETPRAAYGLVDEKGCPMDTDGDEVPDYIDECPETPAEAKGHVDAKGCLLDTDHDEVPDYLDACPTVAGMKYNKGCPEVQKEVKTLLQKAMQGIEFETGKAVIKKQSYAILNQIAATFIANPTYKVEVQGHTDNVGKPEMNKELSEKRAQAVRKHLIDAGVPATQLTAHGYGDEKPIADNDTKAGRAKNRRVEFNITFEEISYETVLEHVDSTLLQEHLESIRPAEMLPDAPAVTDSPAEMEKKEALPEDLN